MEIADLLRLVRSGQIELAAKYDALSEKVKIHYQACVTKEEDQQIRLAIYAHQGPLVYFLRLNDVAICQDPGLHAPYHVEAEALGEHYQKCTECERLREALAATY